MSTAAASPAASGTPAVLALPGGVVWAYEGAQVLRSTDAGATWKVVLPTWALTQMSLQVTGAFFRNARDAWAETEHQWPAQPGATTTWQTTDGGATWHQGISLPGAPVYGAPGFDEFSFADADHGFGFGVDGVGTTGFDEQRQDYLWATSNGGYDWHQVAAAALPWQGTTYSEVSAKGCSEPDPFNLTAVTATVVVLADAGCPAREPDLWQGTDGGRQWGPVHLPAPPGGWAAAEAWHYPGVGEQGAEVLAVRYFADGQGVVAVTTRPGELVVYRSAGIGEPWLTASVLETGSLDRPAGFWASSPTVWEMPAPAGLYVTADAGQHWALQRSGLSLPDMTEVSFASTASGIGFANYPEVGLASTGDVGLRTGDGGQSWEPVQFSPPAFLGNRTMEAPFATVDFVSAEDGWVGGANGVEATADGGTTWASQLSTPEPVEELSFVGPRHGWALTSDELFATRDGGLEWSAQPQTALGAFSYVQLVSPSFGVGLICDQAGGTRLLATYDQGRTWSLLPVPDPDEVLCGGVPPSPGTMSGLCFGTAQVGWVVLHSPDGGPAVIETSDDGGLHWSPVATVNAWPDPFTCEGASDAWLGFTYGEHGGIGAVAATADGGRTWLISAHPVPHEAVLVPEVMPVDRTPVGTLGTSESPPGILALPVAELAAPAPGDAVDLWEDYGPACASGFGLAITTDGGTTWTGAPDEAPSHCGTTSLPFLGAVDYFAPSFSFPDAEDGFVLGPATGTPALRETGVEQITMDLVATDDTGKSWHLLARFPWRSPGPGAHALLEGPSGEHRPEVSSAARVAVVHH